MHQPVNHSSVAEARTLKRSCVARATCRVQGACLRPENDFHVMCSPTECTNVQRIYVAPGNRAAVSWSLGVTDLWFFHRTKKLENDLKISSHYSLVWVNTTTHYSLVETFQVFLNCLFRGRCYSGKVLVRRLQSTGLTHDTLNPISFSRTKSETVLRRLLARTLAVKYRLNALASVSSCANSAARPCLTSQAGRAGARAVGRAGSRADRKIPTNDRRTPMTLSVSIDGLPDVANRRVIPAPYRPRDRRRA